MACRTVRKERDNYFTMVFQYEPTLIGNVNEDSIHIGNKFKRFDKQRY